MPEKLISEILDLPERVRKGDFVLNLSKGVNEPAKMLAQYMVAPQLAASFEDALGLIRAAVWNHLQPATAIVAYCDACEHEAGEAKRLTPLLAGLDQLLPWIHEWVNENAGQSFEITPKAGTHELGTMPEAIRDWEPPATPRRSTRKGKSA